MRDSIARLRLGLATARRREGKARLVGADGRVERQLNATREALRISRQKTRQARRQVTRLRAELKQLRHERKMSTRAVENWQEAAAWLDQESQSVGSGARGGNRLRARLTAAALVEALSRGEDPSAALVAYAHGLAQLPQYPFRYRLPALASALASSEEFRPGVHAALAVHGHYADHPELARHHLERCGEKAAALIPVEFARIRLADDARAANEVLQSLLRLADPAPPEWLDILSAISATHDLGVLAKAVDALGQQAVAWDPEEQRVFARFVEYAGRAGTTSAVPDADLIFGVMGYRRADVRLSSRNLGDFTQTLAALSHLLRRSGLRLSGDPELVATAEMLRSRVRPELVIDDADASVALVEVSRDDSVLDDIPPGTWYIAFGWHLHPDALGGHGLPYHPNLRPIFVSFHCNRRDMLSVEAVDYLRRFAPIGCRDWYTVDLLTYLDVPAFFTGCLTTTVDAYFGSHAGQGDLPVGYVDARPPRGGERMRQLDQEVRHRSLAENLRVALDTLDGYRTNYSSLVTGRLHCYLPATSIGVPTEFRPKRTFDVRFEGLTDDTANLDAIRDRLRDALLEPVLSAITSGAKEDEVYGLWRSITEPMVAADAVTRDAAYEWPDTSLDVSATLEAIGKAAWARPVRRETADHVVDLCVVLDKNYLTQLYTVIDRCLDHTDRPLRVWALVRDLGTADFEAFARSFPEVDVTFLPCDGVDYGDLTVGASRITVSTMDRLLLPELLRDVEKCLYLDLDLLPRADLGDLFDTPLDDASIAARPSPSMSAMGGIVGFAEIAHHHYPDSPDAWRLLNLVHRRTAAGDAGFNAGVLVLNLRRMRDDRFLFRYAGFAQEFGLNDQHVLNLYAGASFVELDLQWNAWPERDVLDDPAIVHWVGPLKPWDETRVGFQDEWRAAVAAMLHRRGGPLSTG